MQASDEGEPHDYVTIYKDRSCKEFWGGVQRIGGTTSECADCLPDVDCLGSYQDRRMLSGIIKPGALTVYSAPGLYYTVPCCKGP